ncbi:GIY-YIG nuclease family protein [Planococcus halocryophilus]|uniref:GIY-YIG nuclease family protein n=1 Tax=Planococcus halocryophilus TaxID=1215089 RepID=UPI001F0E15D1|nr:GIY-YIG nuclease family protein [Planococcus halocryophilus]MCH4825771.1 GIY-YIG nuclease family protein [Planococcus halocryophilus]
MTRVHEHIIYKAENKVTGEIYIGATKATLKSRKYSHEHKAAKNPIGKLHQSIAEHGKENFEWEVIDSADNKEDALLLEGVYINQYLSYYTGLNGNKYGKQGLSGRRHSEEAKSMMREKKLGVSKSDKHKLNMSKSAIGKHVGELSGMAKLTEKDVREIRRLLKATKLTLQDIANFFDVSHSTISSIKHCRTWKHVA